MHEPHLRSPQRLTLLSLEPFDVSRILEKWKFSVSIYTANVWNGLNRAKRLNDLNNLNGVERLRTGYWNDWNRISFARGRLRTLTLATIGGYFFNLSLYFQF